MVNAFEPFVEGAVMRPKLVELMLVVGLAKWGVLVMAMPSMRNSTLYRSLILNRLSRFKSRSNRPGPVKLL